MKGRQTLLFLVLVLLCQGYTQELSDEDYVEKLEDELESLSPQYLTNFVSFYHLPTESQSPNLLNMSRVYVNKAAYLTLVAKMYLYQILPDNTVPQLRPYNTDSSYIAAYYYLRVAAQKYENKEAYYLLGILQQFKLVPDKVIQQNLQALSNRTQQQEILLKYLQQSHLYNSQSNLFMGSAFGHHGASLILAYMNRFRLGTSKNCTTALAYYLSVIKETYVQQFYFRQIYNSQDTFQENLYTKKKLSAPRKHQENHFIENTDYFDQQIIDATRELASNYYTGSYGFKRNLTRAANLYQKLAEGGSKNGKLMAGICYYKGQGVPVNRAKAAKYFTEISNDQIAQYMLLSMKYYEMIEKNTKQSALSAMLQKYKNWKKGVVKSLGIHTSYLVGSIIIQGQLTDKDKDGKQVAVPQADGYKLLDIAAELGNPMAKVLLAILYADGASGLKYGCEEAVKYLYQESWSFPFFKNRISMAHYALLHGNLAFGLMKYMELTLTGYENAYVNIVYLLQVYGKHILKFNPLSWSPKSFSKNPVYKELQQNGFVNIESFLLKLYTVKGKRAVNLNNLDKRLITKDTQASSIKNYIRVKVIKWGSLFQKKNILKYYQYQLTQEEGGNVIPILNQLASGDSSKLYVLEARYLLGRYQHRKALENKTSLTPPQHFRILGEYSRSVKSEFIGLIIFHIEGFLLGNDIGLNFFESSVGKDLLGYIFILSVGLFVLYYLRSKRIDHFHRTQLEKQLRKAAEERELEQQNIGTTEQLREAPGTEIEEDDQDSKNQPIIIQDDVKGVRIGSSYDELKHD